MSPRFASIWPLKRLQIATCCVFRKLLLLLLQLRRSPIWPLANPIGARGLRSGRCAATTSSTSARATSGAGKRAGQLVRVRRL